jgi:hypothetical protein
MTNYGKLTTVLIAVWFVLALSASSLHMISNAPNEPPLHLGLAAITPLALFMVWFVASPGFRQFTMTLNPRVLTWVQSWRIAGFLFLVLAAYGILPKLFALPAGWGDMTIGATSVFVGLKLASPAHRKSFIVWQFLGIADLITAIALGALASVIDPHGVATGAMTELPLSMIPTFAVPLLMIFHIICIAQAMQWPIRRYSAIPEPLPSA